MNNNLENYYISNKHMIIYEMNGKYIIFDTIKGIEIEISSVLLEIVRIFAMPITIKAAMSITSNKYNINNEDLSKLITEIINKELIVKFEPDDNSQYKKNSISMFNVSYCDFDNALNAGIDVLFLGIPYDAGVTNRPGCRFGPDYIRRASTSLYSHNFQKGTVIGVWDSIKNKRVLQNVLMADCGNLFSNLFSRNDVNYRNIEKIIELTIAKDIFPVVLGGDHSITLPIINGILKNYNEIGIIQFDAHSDYSSVPTSDYIKAVHHGNFMNWIIHNDKVANIIQIGNRQVEEVHNECKKVKIFPGKSAVTELFKYINTLSNSIPYYITVDIDCLEPYIVRSTGTPLPGGLTDSELITLIHQVCTKFNIIGMDLVELIPSNDDIEGLIASNIIYNVISDVKK